MGNNIFSIVLTGGAAILFIALLAYSFFGKKNLSEALTTEPRKKLENIMLWTTLIECVALAIMAFMGGMDLGAALLRYLVLGLLDVSMSFLFITTVAKAVTRGEITGGSWATIGLFFIGTLFTTFLIYLAYCEQQKAFIVYLSGGFFPKIYWNPNSEAISLVVIFMIWCNHILQFINFVYIKQDYNIYKELRAMVLRKVDEKDILSAYPATKQSMVKGFLEEVRLDLKKKELMDGNVKPGEKPKDDTPINSKVNNNAIYAFYEERMSGKFNKDQLAGKVANLESAKKLDFMDKLAQNKAAIDKLEAGITAATAAAVKAQVEVKLAEAKTLFQGIGVNVKN